jgi:hypothetical protein
MFRQAVVVATESSRPGIQRVTVRLDGSEQLDPAYALTDLIAECMVGDRVIVNTTALQLRLGTGGSHVVHWNLSRDPLDLSSGSTGMKARYLSEQCDVEMVEESTDVGAGVRTVPLFGIGTFLHWQVGFVAAALKAHSPDTRIAYIMTDSASLPYAISDLVDQLTASQLISQTLSTGQAFGAQHEAVNVASALQFVSDSSVADVVIVGPGPGVVGTNSTYGFGSLDLVTSAYWMNQLGIASTIALRGSDNDERERHRNISHHSITVLRNLAAPTTIGVASMDRALIDTTDLNTILLQECADDDVSKTNEDTLQMLADCSITLRSMGRLVSDDHLSMRLASAAVLTARRLA